jgi:hypothetical protein
LSFLRTASQGGFIYAQPLPTGSFFEKERITQQWSSPNVIWWWQKIKSSAKNVPKSPDLKEEFFSATGDNGFFPLVTKRY